MSVEDPVQIEDRDSSLKESRQRPCAAVEQERLAGDFDEEAGRPPPEAWDRRPGTKDH